jgi:ribosomal protein L30E
MPDQNEDQNQEPTLTPHDLLMIQGESALQQQTNGFHQGDAKLAEQLHEDFLSVFNRMGPSNLLLNVASVLTASAASIRFQVEQVPEGERDSLEAQSALGQLHVVNHAVQMLELTASMVKPFGIVMKITNEEEESDGSTD